MGRKLRVCYVLAYYSPDYIRTLTLVTALKMVQGVELFQARNTTPGAWRYVQTLGRLLYIRLRYNPDCYILGFRGHDIFWPVRIMAWGKILIFDELMSPSDAIINEGKRSRKGTWGGRLIFLYEKLILHVADLILTDTVSHKSFLMRFFSLSEEKVAALPVAADEELFFPAVQIPRGKVPGKFFNLLFYGSFLPLHGIEVILDAASLLCEEPIRFTMIGGARRDEQRLREKINRLGLDNVRYLRWVDFTDLPELIAECDLGLGGPFADTAQARRIVTGKTFQFLAMAKPVVVGRTDESHGFVDKVNALMVSRGDARELVDAVMWAFHHREELISIGVRGRRLYDEQFSLAVLEKRLREVLRRIISSRQRNNIIDI